MAARQAHDAGRKHTIRIVPAGLEGILEFPAGEARGIVLFAHGSGSSRLSPRNNFVAAELRRAGLATLLFDLLSDGEAADRANVFDIALLGARLVEATESISRLQETSGLPIGYFGASTGAAAALVAAVRLSGRISAIVSRGGRPDLAAGALPHVVAPTLLIVGGADEQVLALNRSALRQLRCVAKLEIVPGATHLFEEPGALDRVVASARRWFVDYLAAAGAEERVDVR
jgi:putative phosphoribosyl transferase